MLSDEMKPRKLSVLNFYQLFVVILFEKERFNRAENENILKYSVAKICPLNLFQQMRKDFA